MKKRTAKPGDEKWSDDKQRCWDFLVRLVGGEHRLSNVYHFGDGLRMSTGQDLETFDSGLLTWMANRNHCRVSTDSSGPGGVAVHVWACQFEGNMSARHPGLNDSMAMAERARRAEP